MESKYITPEKNLILRIIEQWGNAAIMGEMEQWLKDYANSTKGELINALRQIEQMSDPGDYYKAICDMKSIATNALSGDESAAGWEEAVDVDELWDEHAEYIDDNIDELVRWAGSTVVTREQFNKMMAKFKQQKEK